MVGSFRCSTRSVTFLLAWVRRPDVARRVFGIAADLVVDPEIGVLVFQLVQSEQGVAEGLDRLFCIVAGERRQGAVDEHRDAPPEGVNSDADLGAADGKLVPAWFDPGTPTSMVLVPRANGAQPEPSQGRRRIFTLAHGRPRDLLAALRDGDHAIWDGLLPGEVGPVHHRLRLVMGRLLVNSGGRA